MVSSKSSKNLHSKLLISAAFVLGLVPQLAWSQAASEVTPSDFSPGLQALDGSVQFTGQPGTEAPPGSENIGIRLSGVSLRGGFEEMAEANAALEARLTRDRIPVSELFEATADLEAAYARAGFVLARVVLPVQSLQDGGVLAVEVIDGFVEAVNTDAVPEKVRGRVDALTEVLVDRPRLPQSVLEKQVLLASDMPGLALSSAISAGLKPGGTVLTLDGTFKPYTGFASMDNSLPETLGNVALNAGFEINGALERGEVFYGRFSSSAEKLLQDDVPYQAIAAGFVVPVGLSGLLVNLEVSSSKTTPKDQVSPTQSEFRRTSLRLNYPVLRTRQKTITTSFTLDKIDDSQELTTGTPVYEDALAVARLGASMDLLQDSYSLRIAGTSSFGLSGFGARSAEDAAGSSVPLSRAGSDSDFRKLNVSLDYSRALSERVSMRFNAEAQTNGGEPLPGAEQISVGGPGRISGVDGSDVRGDSGYFARVQFSTQFQPAAAVALNPYFFAAAGRVTIENPTAVEEAEVTASAFGLGVDLFREGATQFNALRGNLEVSFKDASNGSRDTSVGFSISQRF